MELKVEEEEGGECANNNLKDMLIWEKMCALDIRAELIKSARNTKDKCEKRGL